MQLKIIKASEPTYWYAKKLGSIYDYDIPPKESNTLNVKVVTNKSIQWKQVLKKDVEFIK